MQVRVLLLPLLSCGRASRSWTTQAGGSAAPHACHGSEQSILPHSSQQPAMRLLCGQTIAVVHWPTTQWAMVLLQSGTEHCRAALLKASRDYCVCSVVHYF